MELDPKLLVLVGATAVAGLLGARSLMTAVPVDDPGLGDLQLLPMGAASADAPPLDFEPPDSLRNPFLDPRASSDGSSVGGLSEVDDPDIEPDVGSQGSSDATEG